MGLETSYLALAADYLTAGKVEKARECIKQARRFPAVKDHKKWLNELEARCKGR